MTPSSVRMMRPTTLGANSADSTAIARAIGNASAVAMIKSSMLPQSAGARP